MNNQDNFIYGPYTPTLEKHIDFLKNIDEHEFRKMSQYSYNANETYEIKFAYAEIDASILINQNRLEEIERLCNDVDHILYERFKLSLDKKNFKSMQHHSNAMHALMFQDIITKEQFNLMYTPWGKAIADLQPYKHD